jgi:hypothetical protein
MNADAFSTAGIRERVLASWGAAPERLREDANSEEDLALGGYRERVLVELAQNAADAAVRAGVPGRLLLRLVEGDEPALVAANTGARLDASGVLALSTLRASAKRDGAGGTTGRFGVGFSAVLALSDEPAVLSHGDGVRFSRSQTLAEVRELGRTRPAVLQELTRRDDHVPVLRLPFPAEGSAPPGYDTVVLLPLRDGSALDLARRLLEGLDDALLVALPALREVVVELPHQSPRRLADAEERWETLQRSGTHAPELLADRPTEERARPDWSLTWAVPRDPSTPVPRTVHAPTPTDEPLGWPALLVADLPLDPDRRHVVPGAAAQAVVDAAAEAYGDLLQRLAEEGTDVLRLVPSDLPGGWVAGALRDAVLARLPEVRLLPSAVDAQRLLRPRDAVALSGAGVHDVALLSVLAPLVDGLVPVRPGDETALRLLGVARTSLADVVEQWPPVGSASDWAATYRALLPAATDPSVREALAGLPVPLADGRIVRGARGLLLPSAEVGVEALAALHDHGLRAVHPQVACDPAASDLLERLGATTASAATVLEHPAVRAAVAWTADDPEPDEVVDAVLALVGAALGASAWTPGSYPYLGDLALPDDEGELAPAGMLVRPGSPMADLLDPEAVGRLDEAAASRWSVEVLQAVGVAGLPVLVRVDDSDPDDLPPELGELDGAPEWAEELADGIRGAVLEGPVLAVRDLDLVVDDGWPALVGLLADDRALRDAVVQPVTVRTPQGARRGPSYTAWWLWRHLGLVGHRQAGPGPDDLLLPVAPAWTADVPSDLAAALGLVGALEELDAVAWQGALDRLAAADEVGVDVLLRVWAALAALEPGNGLDPGADPWALGADGLPARQPSERVVVVDDARWWQRTDLGGRVVAPPGRAEDLADLLDLDLASERSDGVVTSSGETVPLAAEVTARWPSLPGTWREHDDLTVDGVAVDWWVEQDASRTVLHAATSDGLARAVAFAAGRWADRHLVAALLEGGDAAASALVDDALG